MRKILNLLYVVLVSSSLGKIFIKVLDVFHISNLIRRIVYFLEFITGGKKNSKLYFKEHKDEITTVEKLLSDDFSIESYRAAIKFRSTSFQHDLLKIYCPTSEQYFDPVTKLSNSESFVDCGAFTGDTIESFIHTLHLNNCWEYEHIYAFEPDPKNCSILRKFITDNKLKDVDVFEYATGKTRTTALFETGENENASSKISGSVNNAADVYKRNCIEVQVDTLDNILADKKISFIKMDIEGAETDTLLGAKNIIQTQKPKLAICIYHSDKDMIHIPLLIHELVPDYKLYVRHYSDTWIETVLYAIP